MMRNNTRYRIKTVVKPKRPFGVAIVASIGMLVGLALTWFVISLALGRINQGVPTEQWVIQFGIGLAIAWGIIWIHWALWDLMSWAWWFDILLAIASVVTLIAFMPHLSSLMLTVATAIGATVTQQLVTSLNIGSIIFIIFQLCSAAYLLFVHQAFGVGVERPAWERRQF